MLRTIIAGCDGREPGRGAVSLAHAIPWATGARLLLAGGAASSPAPGHLRPTSATRLSTSCAPSATNSRPGRSCASWGSLARTRLAHRRRRGERGPARGRLAAPPAPATDRRERSGHAGAARGVLRGRGRARPGGGPSGAPSNRHATPESALAVVMARELAQRTGARLSLYAVRHRRSRSPSSRPARHRAVVGTRCAELVGRHAECRGRAIDVELWALEQLLGDEEAARVPARVGGVERTREQATGDVGRVGAHRHDEHELRVAGAR